MKKDTELELEQAQAVIAGLGDVPYCPRCYGTHGILGTEGAYYICYNAQCDSNISYYAPSTFGMSWADLVAASPFRKR